MRIHFTGRKAQLNVRERGKLDRKLGKIQRILSRRGGLEAHVRLSRQRHLFEAELTLRALRHTLVVTATGVTEFVALQAALDKLEKQALRNKRKIIDSHRPGRQRDRPSAMVAHSIRRFESSLEVVVQEPPARPRIVRSPAPEGKPMTAEEALLALEDDGRAFVSFRDADTGRINVLIRRPDGAAELVEGG